MAVAVAVVGIVGGGGVVVVVANMASDRAAGLGMWSIKEESAAWLLFSGRSTANMAGGEQSVAVLLCVVYNKRARGFMRNNVYSLEL